MSASEGAGVSVIIPTWNEAGTVERTLEALAPPRGGGLHARSTAPGASGEIEVIVCDGGSTDATWERLALFPWARRIVGARGRAGQMNAGAAAARGRILLFLHADSVVERDAVARLPAALAARPDAVGGAFRFRLDSPRRRYRVVEWGVARRCRYLRLPYGDQGLFLRRASFEALAGFRDFPVGEDLDLVRRMKRLGPLLLLDDCVTTSARRWERDGFLRTTLRNGRDLVRLSISGWREQRTTRATTGPRPAPASGPAAPRRGVV